MKELIYPYFQFLFRPFRIHRVFRKRRDPRLAPLLPTLHTPKLKRPAAINRPFNFLEVALLSWACVMINGVYSLVFLHVQAKTFFQAAGMMSPLPSILSSASSLYFKFSLFTMIVGILLFPFVLFIKNTFWELLIRSFSFFVLPASDSENRKQIAKDIVNQSLCSYAFLCVPFIGGLLQFFSQFVYLYAGLTENLKLSSFESALILSFPFILLSVSVFTFILGLALLFI